MKWNSTRSTSRLTLAYRCLDHGGGEVRGGGRPPPFSPGSATDAPLHYLLFCKVSGSILKVCGKYYTHLSGNLVSFLTVKFL